MFPLPTKDIQGARQVAGDYGDAAFASQGLFARLKVQHLDGPEGSEEAGEDLLPPYAGAYWTEHSERNAMPSAAASLGLGEGVIRRLGRWQPGQVTDP